MTGQATATPAGPAVGAFLVSSRAAPILAVLLALLAIWYVAALPMNAAQLSRQFARIDPDRTFSLAERLRATWTVQRPMLPTPDMIVRDFWQTSTTDPITSKRNLLFHVGVTAVATVTGFVAGALLGIALAVGIVHLRTLDSSLMPWLIASQTVPILAIAPMLLAVLGALSVTSLVAKAAISMYLCFFPVTVSMVKGLRSPDVLALDLMRTYSATQYQVFTKLRWPAAVPFLFTSLKVAIALGLVGAMVAELSTGGQAGLGGRLLTASYIGNMLHMWTALITSSILAVLMVAGVARLERLVVDSMGGAAPKAGA